MLHRAYYTGVLSTQYLAQISCPEQLFHRSLNNSVDIGGNNKILSYQL
jgi:hypothetical protein